MHRPITVERRKAGTEILMRILDLQKKLSVFKKQAETFDLLFSLTIQAKYLKPFAHVQNVLIQFYSPKNIQSGDQFLYFRDFLCELLQKGLLICFVPIETLISLSHL